MFPSTSGSPQALRTTLPTAPQATRQFKLGTFLYGIVYESVLTSTAPKAQSSIVVVTGALDPWVSPEQFLTMQPFGGHLLDAMACSGPRNEACFLPLNAHSHTHCSASSTAITANRLPSPMVVRMYRS